MNRVKYNRIKGFAIICFIILVVEILYVSYSVINNKQKSIYFVGINAVEISDDFYVTVGSNNDNDNHYEKAAISEYNLKREKTFEKLYNVGYNSAFFDITMDKDSIIAVGSYEKNKKQHDELIRDALIVKYDKDGNVLFESDFNVLDNAKFTSVIKCGDSYLVAGQSVYKNTRIGDGDGGAILAKYDTDGKLLWYKTYGNSKESIFNDLIIVGNYIYAVGSGDNSYGIIVKYDLDGNYIDSNDYRVTDSLGFTSIANSGNYLYVSGAVKSGDYDTDGIIVKYNLNCRYINQVIYAEDGIEKFNKLVIDDHNNIVAIGTKAIPRKNNKKNYSEYNYDGIIAKYNTRLSNIDSVTYGDESDDFFTDIKAIQGKYIVVGYSSYGDDSYMSKFISYSSALKVLEVG